MLLLCYAVGGHLQFFYSLHSIPCVGFSAYYNGKSMVYSGDTYNDPAGISKMYEKGLMSAARRDQLLRFPWHRFDVVLHESGVPPIHTPLETLEAMPPEVKEKLYIVHKPSEKVPRDRGLKPALVGPENTIVISNEPALNSLALEVLDLVGGVEVFADFVLAR